MVVDVKRSDRQIAHSRKTLHEEALVAGGGILHCKRLTTLRPELRWKIV